MSSILIFYSSPMLWCAVMCYGVLWCAMRGVLWCAVVCCGVLWCSVVFCGVLWCAVVFCGVLWCAVVCCGVLWCGVLWCGVVCYGVQWCAMRGVLWCAIYRDKHAIITIIRKIIMYALLIIFILALIRNKNLCLKNCFKRNFTHPGIMHNSSTKTNLKSSTNKVIEHFNI